MWWLTHLRGWHPSVATTHQLSLPKLAIRQRNGTARVDLKTDTRNEECGTPPRAWVRRCSR
jgi:hypothetical protein